MGDRSQSSERPALPDPATPKPSLPPGMVLGPDGKPCKICTAFRNWRPAASATTKNATLPPHCPPDVEALGRATWSFLHATAAYYPVRPTTHQRANMLNLIHALPALYPCTHCAADFGDKMKEHPPDVSSRERLSKWFCERHNEVNEKLGKEMFDCAKVDERWKDGPPDGSCD
ncbi:ERV/ALR sulfhydryl oxidase domain-containing protein [Suillus subaureus]|uniref:Sulfhydryl oxidase n=1 Tax=Suillus subaureus TaxID=48587 RepID=A0A9P7E6M8_9AGAM|nr:ERV/ALR sulfhydryl oxidase domain-containing protein [Suillus subaureus]KAG1812428.1 ERV/ALR sulfhydryl oxidase domain-containing protein [Suillus subaureus]